MKPNTAKVLFQFQCHKCSAKMRVWSDRDQAIRNPLPCHIARCDGVMSINQDMPVLRTGSLPIDADMVFTPNTTVVINVRYRNVMARLAEMGVHTKEDVAGAIHNELISNLGNTVAITREQYLEVMAIETEEREAAEKDPKELLKLIVMKHAAEDFPVPDNLVHDILEAGFHL